MLKDNFKQQTDQIKKLLAQIRGDFHKRDQKKQEGKMTGMIEAEIRGQISTLGKKTKKLIFFLDRELDQVSLLINEYQNDASKYNLLAREIDKRRNIYVQFVNQRNDLKKRIEGNNLPVFEQKAGLKQNNIMINIVQQTFGQKYEGMSDKDQFQVQKNMQEDQDEQINLINEKLVNVKYIGMGIQENISNQNKLIDNLTGDSDKILGSMSKTRNKMQKFVNQSSSCGLLTIIFFEIVGLLMILILL